MAILGPHLSTGLVLGFASHMIVEFNNMVKKGIDEENDFTLLDLLHHYTAGFKAFATEYQYYSSDEMRQACGGAGMLLSSGVAQNWADGSPMATFEGVNVIMYQQSARYIFK